MDTVDQCLLVLMPGSFIEDFAFNPESQPQNSFFKEIIPRIAAIVSQFFLCMKVFGNFLVVLFIM
ncbi:MAG: hypothetical protein KR126chlam6_01307 [Candidatus Anoxychlamydiales bacterium]|nr:hypothetical protein [Candidatus Anoxychlamydiales bacterium]